MEWFPTTRNIPEVGKGLNEGLILPILVSHYNVAQA